MNKKVILSAIISIVLCFSLVVGGTFALFTSEYKTNISITSGTVDVKAEVTLDSLYSPTLNLDGTVADSTNLADKTFANGGTVNVDGAEIKITNMTPGDKATFKVTVTNSSDVAFMQRITLGCPDEDKVFFNELLIGLSDDGVNYTYYSDFATAWEQGTPITEGGEPTVQTKYITIEMPGYVGNKWQSKNCTLVLNVVAVQGNAVVTDEAIEEITTVVDAAGIAQAIANAADGAEIILIEPVDTLDIAFDDAKTVTLRGYKIGTLNVNIPNATLHVYNNIGKVNGENVAQHTLYVYGEIDSILLNNGRVVVENTAHVGEVKIAPADGAKVKLSIPTTVINDQEVAGIVDRVIIDEIPTDSTVNIIAPETTVIEGEGKDDADTLIGASEISYVENEEKKIVYINDAIGLAALATKVNAGTTFAGWTVKLTNDIDLENKEWTPIGTRTNPFKASFDGQEYTISNLYINKQIGNIASSNRQGLFGTIVPSGATYFKNLTLHNANVTAGYHCGAIIATSDGSSQTHTGNYLVVTDVNLTGKVTVEGYLGVAGVKGSGNMAEISNITVDVEQGSYVSNENAGVYVLASCVGSVYGGGYLAKVDNITSNMDVRGIICGTGGLFGVIGGQNVKCYVSNLSYSGTVTMLDTSVDLQSGIHQYSYNALLIGAPRFSLIADQATCTSTGNLVLHTEEGIKTSNDMGEIFTWGVDLFGASVDAVYTNKSYAKDYAED